MRVLLSTLLAFTAACASSSAGFEGAAPGPSPGGGGGVSFGGAQD